MGIRGNFEVIVSSDCPNFQISETSLSAFARLSPDHSGRRLAAAMQWLCKMNNVYLPERASVANVRGTFVDFVTW